MKTLFAISGLCFVLTINGFAQIDFASPVLKSVGSDIESVAIGDVNSDGLADALVATTFYFDPEYDYSVFVFLQQHDGTVSDPVRYRYSDNYSSKTIVQVADVSNDGKNDVIITLGDSVGIFYQNAEGGLNPIQTMFSGYDADGLKTGDLNNDGLQDIAICHWNDNFIKVFYQLPAGGFQPVEYPLASAGWDEIDVNDMNGDGLDDIIYMPGQSIGPAIYIYYQDRITGIPVTPVPYSYSNSFYSRFHGIATGDLNNDGRNDLVGTMGGNSAWIAIAYQNDDGMLGEATYLPSYDIPTPVEIADLNCDGRNEIIVGHDAWSHFSVWEQNESGNYSDYKLFGSLYYVGPYGLAVGDLNNDNRQDVLSTSGYSTTYFMYNSSAPAGTPHLDTIIRFNSYSIDTLNTFENTYLTSSTSTMNECLLQTNYELHSTTWYVYNQSEGDTLFPRNFFMCGLQQHDTLKAAFEYHNYGNIYHTDSIILSVDTLVSDINILNTIITNDTLNVIPYELNNLQVLYSYHISPDTIYLYIDSLLIHQYKLDIEYIETIVTVYEGLKCGYPVNDSLVEEHHLWKDIILLSDTTLISRTVVAYPTGIAEVSNELSLKIYPNPAHDICSLEIPKDQINEGPWAIDLISIAGQIMWKTEIPSGDCQKIIINGHNLPQGIYTVIVRGKNRYGAAKLVFSN